MTSALTKRSRSARDPLRHGLDRHDHEQEDDDNDGDDEDGKRRNQETLPKKARLGRTQDEAGQSQYLLF